MDGKHGFRLRCSREKGAHYSEQSKQTKTLVIMFVVDEFYVFFTLKCDKI